MNIFNYTSLNRLFLMVLLTSCCLLSCKEEYDHTLDVTNPVVVSFNPVLGVEEVSVNSHLVLTFDKDVKKGVGNIVITGESATRTIDVNSDAVTIGDDARVVTINPGELESDETYTVTVDPGALTDLLDNKYMGTIAATPWTFTTAGNSGPLVIAQSPAQGSTDGSLFKLQLTFLAEVKKGTGNVAVYTSNNTKVAELSIASSNVTVQGSMVVINLNTPLEFATDYYVTMDSGALLDADDKKFKGFKGSTGWTFTTTSGSGSDLAVYLPLDQDLSDASGNRFDASNGSTASAPVEFTNDPIRGKVANFVAGSFAVLPKHSMLRPSLTQNFSINIWMKLKGIGSDPALFSNSDWGSGGNPGLVLCTDGGATYTGPGSTGRGWITKVAGGGKRLDWRAGSMTPQAPALSDNEWHMVTIIYNQTIKRLQVYIDGVEYTQADNASSYDLSTLTGPLWDETNDYPFTIWEDGTGQYNANSDTRKALAGFVDDLRIYNKALTPEEITELFQ
ncbi:Ig-like domain-containing protein [Dyadobacter jejuensis]|uniref:Ig-like domain-containing protein n=1 Tax=Dyadobacter jejuensis TaxID=1082580 RepID=A0A316AH37_9BACT|nr:Ig-like domain-containing protein [Dyadobacter jejuensis]PWJ57055.1 Ig-like domain-containing protein [Dyadobacter jejuensis]